MLSKESTALRHTYGAMVERIAANPPGIDFDSGMSRLAAEPTNVTYEEIAAAGLSAIWAIPVHCDTDRVIVYFHGGGFVGGSADSHRKIAAHLAKAAGYRALIPEYRLAPQHPFPSPLEDARALHAWLLEQGYAPSKIAFAGDSAGGNIATAATLALRRDSLPLPGAIVAFSPWYDMEVKGETFEANAATCGFVSRELAEATAAMYLAGHSPTDPLANPLYSDPAGLPPILLTCGRHEKWQDNAERFAALARRSGVDVELHVGDGMQHVYQCMAGRAVEADNSIAEAGRWLRARLGP